MSQTNGSHRSRLRPAVAVLALLAGMLLVGSTAGLAQPPIGETPYSGSFTMIAGGQPVTGKVFHSREAERRELSTQAGEQVMILRPEAGEALMIMPEAGMALRLPMPDGVGPKGADAFARLNPEKVGEEEVSGEATTVYRTSGPVNGRIWITEDGIVMRMEVEAEEGGFTMELEELVRGEQEAALFEVPAGITVIDGGGMAPPQ